MPDATETPELLGNRPTASVGYPPTLADLDARLERIERILAPLAELWARHGDRLLRLIDNPAARFASRRAGGGKAPQ